MPPDAPASPEVADLLRLALGRRLREVRDLPRSTSGGAAPSPASESRRPGPASDTEESLRRLMVGVLPAVRDRPGPGPDRTRFFALLADLEAPARSADLRFLDAWNSACEVLLAWPREEQDRDDTRRALLAYASLLEAHLRRLGGRP